MWKNGGSRVSDPAVADPDPTLGEEKNHESGSDPWKKSVGSGYGSCSEEIESTYFPIIESQNKKLK